MWGLNVKTKQSVRRLTRITKPTQIAEREDLTLKPDKVGVHIQVCDIWPIRVC